MPTTIVDSCPSKGISTTIKPTTKSECVIEPARFEYQGSVFEYSAFSPSHRFMKEVDSVFPHLTIKERNDLLVVPVIQQCYHDMVGATPEVNKERDEKLELFIEWGKYIVQRLGSVGFWADVTDPASGFPVFGKQGPSPYPDVQATQALTHYDIQNVGCCHILLHPTWKSHIYPATFFTTAPAHILTKVIDELISSQQKQ
ncbi:hypothetical protein BDA99DRAFT_532516 [Phascolomyces articulosus]|uniref:Methylmalonic aciduria and homocystinuria type D protein n=1 Tax=Phascolomyces articulosus TaxID=60185 RepID=A0AAD5PIJ6_9FUNG|nr:hypothetical protein BDA99DRAFT_532516 [Phascolomyces articulosus]